MKVDKDAIIHMLIGTVVDNFMGNRPLNVMLDRLFDRHGNLVTEVVPVARDSRLHFAVERLLGDVQGIHVRCHYHDLVGVGGLIFNMITSDDWMTAFLTSFESPEGHLIHVDFDRSSGWLNISWPMLTTTFEKAVELSKL